MKINTNKKIALSKKVGWPILMFIIFLDAFITYRAGGEGNPLWRPVVEMFGLNALWFLVILVLIFFYLLTRIVGWYIEKFEHYPQGEEIVLTNLVIAFVVYDLYLIFAAPHFGYLGSRYHYAIIPILIIPLIVYNIWLEYQKKKNKKWKYLGKP